MNPWFIVLLPSVALPVLGAVRARRRGPGRKGERGLCTASLHLGCLSLWAFVAAQTAFSGASAAQLQWGTALAILLAGMIWVEAVHLIATRRHGRAVIPDEERSLSGDASHSLPVVERILPSGRSASSEPAAEGRSDPVGKLGDERRRQSEKGADDAPFPAQAKVLLNRILGLNNLPLESIMTGRDNIVFVDGSLTADRALKRMVETRRSRLPVTAGGSPDRILGVVHAKDLVPLVLQDSRKDSVRKYLRRWLRVPRGQSAAQLLEDFRRNRVHVGIVGDPMGRTQGIITLHDIFRSIAGPSSSGPDSKGVGGHS